MTQRLAGAKEQQCCCLVPGGFRAPRWGVPVDPDLLADGRVKNPAESIRPGFEVAFRGVWLRSPEGNECAGSQRAVLHQHVFIIVNHAKSPELDVFLDFVRKENSTAIHV